jgi:hypothetical protein
MDRIGPGGDAMSPYLVLHGMAGASPLFSQAANPGAASPSDLPLKLDGSPPRPLSGSSCFC